MLVCSIAVQVLRILQTFCLGLALGLAVPLGVYFALVPIILLIVLMPITINGIGSDASGIRVALRPRGRRQRTCVGPVYALSGDCGCGESAGGRFCILDGRRNEGRSGPAVFRPGGLA